MAEAGITNVGASRHLPISFFFHATATTETYTLSLHDALPISRRPRQPGEARQPSTRTIGHQPHVLSTVDSVDRKSTRLNSSHMSISYAVFCLKKKRSIM